MIDGRINVIWNKNGVLLAFLPVSLPKRLVASRDPDIVNKNITFAVWSNVRTNATTQGCWANNLAVVCKRMQQLPTSVGTTLPQSPSLLISGSGSWPPALARFWRRKHKKSTKSSSRSRSLAFAAENIKNLPLALRAREKIWVRLVGKSMLGPEVLRGKDTTR